MTKKKFYEILESHTQINDSWHSILTGDKRDDSGFYELCAAFASQTNCEVYSAEVIQSLREYVVRFCQKHGLTIDSNLFTRINQCYILLLPDTSAVPVVGETKEHWQEGGCAFEFKYHSTIPSEIWEAIFGNSMYE